MRGCNLWSYTPFRPPLFEVGDPYICRVVPSPTAIHVEWLAKDGATEYTVYYRVREQGDFIRFATVTALECDITGLTTDLDYEFYVEATGSRSRIRLAHTGEMVGVVINYYHPEDKAYDYAGHCLCSPSLLKHPDGYLLATMDVYGGGEPQNLSFIFRSDDNGETWHYVSEVFPCFWGRTFLLNGDLYLVGMSTEYGDLTIGRSTDGGKTFSAPVSLLRGFGGKGGRGGCHRSPSETLIHNGRIWFNFQWGSWDVWQGYYHSELMASCPVDADPLVPENWSFTEPLIFDKNWDGAVADAENTYGTMEGSPVVGPDGNLYCISRYNYSGGTPPYGVIVAYKIDENDPEAPMAFSHTIRMSCNNNSKLAVQRDEVTGRYFCIANEAVNEEQAMRRNLLSLFVSDDMNNWRVARRLLNALDQDREKVGFQYVNFLFDGEDILFLSRTAINQAESFHNTNCITFHRIENFRNL